MKRFNEGSYAVALAIVSLLVFFVWLVGTATGVLSNYIERLKPEIPNWALLLNLPVLLMLGAIASLRSGLFSEIRIACLAAFLLSCSLIPISMDVYFQATLVTVVLLYLEMFWIVPKINRRRDVNHSQISRCE